MRQVRIRPRARRRPLDDEATDLTPPDRATGRVEELLERIEAALAH